MEAGEPAEFVKCLYKIVGFCLKVKILENIFEILLYKILKYYDIYTCPYFHQYRRETVR